MSSPFRVPVRPVQDPRSARSCCVAVVYYYSYINKIKIFSGMCNVISISTHTQLKVEYWISDSH